MSCNAKAEEKKKRQQVPPNFPKAVGSCTNSMISQQKYVTGHECIRIVLNSDHFTMCFYRANQGSNCPF